jgi:fumarylacetoacetase
MATNETHDPARRSFVESANSGSDFPIQNLPYGVFRRLGSSEPYRVGVAIGDQILDVGAIRHLCTGAAAPAAAACASPRLNDLMALGPRAWSALRAQLSRLLSADGAAHRADLEQNLLSMAVAELALPVEIGNFTDFFASIYHATNAGRMFRPDNPLMPNYKYVPVAYHSRASSVRVSGTPVRRPLGQSKTPEENAPVYRASRALDYEFELGFYVGVPSELGSPVPMAQAGEHIFGFCLLNDWSARDIQAWEYQPLGPFLAKNFATTVSPWVVTAEAIEPFRTAAAVRPSEDPAPLPHLDDPGDRRQGGLAITMEAYLLTQAMREQKQTAFRLSSGNFAEIYWTVAQMLAHHTSNGCNLMVGDLMGSGTVSGPGRESWACLLELTARGREPLDLPSGEKRGFLADGDEIIFRGHCEREGFARIGFGECRATVLPEAPTS